MKIQPRSTCPRAPFFGFLSLLVLAVVLLLPGGCVRAASDGLVLSAPGHTTALIVEDDWAQTFGRDPLAPQRYLQGTDSGAQHILQKHFGDITGQKAVIIKASQVATPEQKANYQTRIWCDRQPEVERVLGDDLKKLDDDGYVIRVRGNDLYLTGKNWWGSVWAAYDLLERFAGCGFYGPGGKDSPFIVVPKREKIVVPVDLNLVENPTYKSRWFRQAPMMTFRLRERDKFHHSFVAIIPPDKYAATHPEYFPIIDGKRWIPPAARAFDFQPNVTAPGLAELVADTATRFFNEHPGAGSFSLGMNDTNKFCECEQCLAVAPARITGKNERIAYAFFDFYNRVAQRVGKTHPDKRLGMLAYGTLTTLPPGSIELSPMLVPYLTLDSAQLFEKRERDEFQPKLDKWVSFSQRMGVYEYAYGGGFLIPRIYNRHLISNVLRQYNAAADGFYAEAYPNWGLDGPKYWLLARLLWDTKQSPEVLLQRYYSDMFGSASGVMRQYFDYLEEVWETQKLESKRSNYRWFQDPIQLKIFSPEQCDHAWSLLQAAGTKTSDKAALARIRYFQDSFALTRTLVMRDAASTAAVNALPGKSANRDAPLETWLPALLKAVELWEQAPDLEQTISAARNLQPPAINNVSWEMLDRSTQAPIGPLQVAAERLNHQAINTLQKDGQPLTRDLVAQRVNSVLDGFEKATPQATHRLREIAKNGAFIIPQANKAPTLDGDINADEYPAPIFDGRFYQFNKFEKQTEKSIVYAAHRSEVLYLAFDLEQEPATVGGAFTGIDKGGWQKPEMLGDDAIVLNFYSPGHYLQSIRVNPNGAVGTVDNQPGSTAWQSAVQAQAKKTAEGWRLEVALDLKKLQVPKAWLNTKPLLMPIARYTRRALPQKANEPTRYRVDVSTLTPAPGGARGYPGGNFTTLMSFINGPRVIFE